MFVVVNDTQLLMEHLPRDPLWPAVRAWEQAVADLLIARRALYIEAERLLSEKSGWHVEKDGPIRRPNLLHGAVEFVYESRLTMSVGIPRKRPEYSQLHEDQEGVIGTASRQLARAPGRRKKVFDLISKTVDELAEAPEIREAVQAQKAVSQALHDVHTALEDFRLLPYLPGTCELCGRTELSAIKTKKGDQR